MWGCEKLTKASEIEFIVHETRKIVAIFLFRPKNPPLTPMLLPKTFVVIEHIYHLKCLESIRHATTHGDIFLLVVEDAGDQADK